MSRSMYDIERAKGFACCECGTMDNVVWNRIDNFLEPICIGCFPDKLHGEADDLEEEANELRSMAKKLEAMRKKGKVVCDD